MWLAIAAAAVGGALAVGFIWPNTAPHEQAEATLRRGIAVCVAMVSMV